MPKERRARTLLVCGTIMAAAQTVILLTAIQVKPEPPIRQTTVPTAFTQALLPTLTPP